jgi:hypothetical protein
LPNQQPQHIEQSKGQLRADYIVVAASLVASIILTLIAMCL